MVDRMLESSRRFRGLRRVDPSTLATHRTAPLDEETLERARGIVSAIRRDGDAALLDHAERLGDRRAGDAEPMVLERAELESARDALPPEDRALLERTDERIARFARAQRDSLQAFETQIPGGRAGQHIRALERAGCYAPGGRYPLPSSVLMTVRTAREAGCSEVWVASPKPTKMTKAAAAVAGADALLAVGGAHAIAALAYGTERVPACDAIVGPGNRWVTAAKSIISGERIIDMLAGPSELLVVADRVELAATIAADLLAQAEHDPDAQVVLVSLGGEELIAAVDEELEIQLRTLPTEPTAIASLEHGLAVVATDRAEAIDICNRVAPEHLECMVEDKAFSAGLTAYGALFLGAATAEVHGDYGAGPNHVLPTGGTARRSGGLSVFTFLRIHTWLEITDPVAAADLTEDAIRLARHEGLEGHARSAERRRPDKG